MIPSSDGIVTVKERRGAARVPVEKPGEPSVYARYSHLTREHQSIDHLAERIRALGYLAPTKLARFLELSDIEEAGHEPGAHAMVEVLARDHQTVAKSLREAVSEADNVDDVFTADMLTARIGRHENFAWMLRALAAKPS